MSHESTTPGTADQWARDVLMIPAEAAREDAARALFDRIRESRFAPSKATVEAMSVVIHGAGHWATMSALPEWRTSVETRLQEDVERFVTLYFSLSPETRGEHWQELVKRATDFPRIRIRLARLESGLSTPGQPPLTATAEVRAMMRGLMSVYLAPPGKRHAALQQADLLNAPEQSRHTARQIQRSYPLWGRLDPTLLRHLAGNAPPVRRVRAPEPVAPSTEETGSYMPVTLIVFVIVGVIRLAMFASGSSSSHHNTTTSYPRPQISIPAVGHGGSDRILQELRASINGDRRLSEHRERPEREFDTITNQPAAAEIPGEPLDDSLEMRRKDLAAQIKSRRAAEIGTRILFGLPPQTEKSP